MKKSGENIINVLSNLPKFMLFFLLYLAWEGTGILIVYLFNYKLFVTLDTIKLLMLSLSVSLPIFFMNTIIYSLKFKFSGKEEEMSKTESGHQKYLKEVLADASVITIFQLYAYIFIFWYIKKSFLHFAVLNIIWFVVYFVHTLIRYKVYNKNAQVNNKTT